MFRKKLLKIDIFPKYLCSCCWSGQPRRGSSPTTRRKDSDIVSLAQTHRSSGDGESVKHDGESVKQDGESVKLSESAKKPGAAYAYDDETSSDSDDEVRQHFQDTVEATAVRRSSSQYSHTSRKSIGRASVGMISVTKLSPASLASHEKHLAGSADSVTVDETAKPQPSPKVEKLIDIETRSTDSPGAGSQSPEGGAEAAPPPSTLATGEGTQIYNNQAFDGVSPSESGHATDEHMFDVSDLEHETTLISKCGSLEVTFDYDPRRSRMTVTIHQAIDIPARERGGANNTQVRLLLLPTKKQRSRTKVKQGDNPTFEESFVFKNLTEADVSGFGLRFRLYGTERMRRERMIGESIIGFASLNLQAPSTHWVVLEPRSNLSGDSNADAASLSHSDSASSTQSLQHGGMPELLIGLSYNGTTGRLSVEVIKGSNFRNMAMNRAPDTYVKLTLMAPNGSEVAHSKTSVRRGQPNPLFKETFMFQVALFQLADVTLMVSVYNKKSMKKKEMIGWFALGHNSSGDEEGSHWTDMRESKGDNICRWHVLLES